MAGRYDTVGTKLGPRLAQLISQATVATRRSLLDTEHTLRVGSAQAIIDATGHEMADLMAPLLNPILASKTLPPEVHAVVEMMASGRRQWQAIAGLAFGASGIPNALSTIVSNALAPTVRAAVRGNPQLVPEVGTLAQLASRGLASTQDVTFEAAGQGIGHKFVGPLIDAAASIPDVTTLLEMVNRGILNESQAREWLTRAGFPVALHGELLLLRFAPLSPADAALAVLRGNMTRDNALIIVGQQGVRPDVFDVMTANTGEPPALESLLELWRRGHISESTLERGIRQSRVRDEWIPAIKELSVMPVPPEEALQALLEGQVSEAEARRRYVEGGGDPTWFINALHTRGSAPTPVEAADMANRGIIPWDGTGPDATTFQQAFLEGPWRNKWLTPYRRLSEYIPPPRTVTTLLTEGSIDAATAEDLLRRNGLSPALAAAYVAGAGKDQTKTARDLAVTQVSALYRDRVISADDAVGMYVELGYSQDNATFLLALADVDRVQRYLETAIGTVHTEYTSHIAGRADTIGSLDSLGVPATQREELLSLWDIERSARTKRLTESQVHSAFKKGLLSQPDAQARLEAMGYPSEDAMIALQL